MMETENIVGLKGKVVEITSKEGVSAKNVNYVSGVVVIETGEDNYVPVSFYAGELNASGQPSPLYKSLMTVTNDFKSIALHGRDEADVIYVDKGQISENLYSPDGERIFKGFQIRSNFFNRAKINDAHASNKFSIAGEVVGVIDELEKDVPTGRVILRLLGVGYNNRPNVFEIIVSEPAHVAYIKNTVSEQQFLKVIGEVIFSEKEIEIEEVLAIGTSVNVKTIVKKELILTGASNVVDSPFSREEVASLSATRQGLIEAAKEKAKKTTKTTTTATPAKGGFSL